MSLLDLHLNDVEDPEILPAGEYEVQISKAELKPSKDEKRMVLHIIYNVVDNPKAQSVFEYLCYPVTEDAENTIYMMSLNLKHFGQAFEIDLDTLSNLPDNSDEAINFKGKTGWAYLKRAKDNNDNDVNQVSKYIVSS